MKFISIFFIIILFFANLKANDKIYFLPDESKKALHQIQKQILSAKNSIEITIYNFTHKKIANSLKDIAKRGVKIKIIFDYESSEKRKDKSMLYYLAKYKNISVYQIKGKLSKNKKYFGKMHQKMAVIDDKTLILGSANWTHSGFGKNYEVIVITHNKKFIKKYKKFFKKVLKKANKFL